jgi:hypothetical protein
LRAAATAIDRISASPDCYAMRDHAAIEQQPLDLVVAPAAPERCSMQTSDRGGVFCHGIGDDRVCACEQAAQGGDQRRHRRGNCEAPWGCASGARR